MEEVIEVKKRRPSVEKLWKDNVDLLLPVDESDYNSFRRAIFLAFDFGDQKLFDKFIDRDLLWMGYKRENFDQVNWFQFAGSGLSNEREAILSTFSYLFENREPYYREHYDFSKEEEMLRLKFRNRIREKYKNAAEYIDRIKAVLFDADLFEFDGFKDLIQKKVFESKLN